MNGSRVDSIDLDNSPASWKLTPLFNIGNDASDWQGGCGLGSRNGVVYAPFQRNDTVVWHTFPHGEAAPSRTVLPEGWSLSPMALPNLRCKGESLAAVLTRGYLDRNSTRMEYRIGEFPVLS